MWLRRIFDSVLIQVILAMVLGILCGLFFGEKVAAVKWIGEAYVRLLQMTAIPYIIVSLVCSIGKLSPAWAGRVGLRGALIVLLLWIVCILTVLAVPIAYPDWPSASYFSPDDVGHTASFNPLALYIPANIFKSLANTVLPAVILFCISFGVALIFVEGKTQLIGTLQAVIDTLGRMASFIAKFTPIAFFAVAAYAAGMLEFKELNRLQIYLATYLLAWLLLVFWTFPALVSLSSPFSYKAVLRNAQLAMLTAFAAGTVLVALPLIAESCKKMLKASGFSDKESVATAEMMVPISYSLPKAGAFLGLGFILFAAWFVGAPLSLSQYPAFASVGVVAIFGGLTVALPFMLNFCGLAADLFQLYLVSAALTINLQAALGAMHGVAVCMLAACAVIGRLRWRRLVVGIALSVAIAMAIFTGSYHVFSRLIPFEYSADEEFFAKQLLNEPVAAEHVTDPSPLPATDLYLDRLQVIRERGSLRVGYRRQDRLPGIFLNSQQELVGMEMEFMHTLARDLGVRLELVQVKEEKVVEWLDDGRIDIMEGSALTPERAGVVSFTRPYLTLNLGLVVPDHERHRFAELDSVAQMQPLKVAVAPLHYLPYYLDQASQRLSNVQFVKVDSAKQFFKGQLQGVDALFSSVEMGAAWTFMYPHFSAVVPAGLNLKVPIGFAVARNQLHWLVFLNSWLDLKISTGVTERYYDYWVLGKKVKGPKKRWSVFRNVLKWAD